MKYDFTTIMDRRGMDAIAVDKIPYENVQVEEGFSTIPMWVADMNFQTVPTIPEQNMRRMVILNQEKNTMMQSSTGIRPEMV